MEVCSYVSEKQTFSKVIEGVYKMLENKSTVIDEAKGSDEARRIIEESIVRYNEIFENK